MKKLIFVLLALLLIAACKEQATETVGTAQPAEVKEVPKEDVKPAEQQQSLTDLKAVFSSMGEYQCTAKMEQGMATFYVKSGKIRTTMVASGIEANSVYNGDDVWTWSAQGCFHMRMSELQALASQTPQAAAPTKDEMAENAADVKCNPTSVPESMFTAPSPCQEMSELMKQMMQ